MVTFSRTRSPARRSRGTDFHALPSGEMTAAFSSSATDAFLPFQTLSRFRNSSVSVAPGRACEPEVEVARRAVRGGPLVVVEQVDEDRAVGRSLVPERRGVLEARVDELQPRLRGLRRASGRRRPAALLLPDQLREEPGRLVADHVVVRPGWGGDRRTSRAGRGNGRRAGCPSPRPGRPGRTA